MPQVILLESYNGLSSFTYEVSCTGRLLSADEVRQRDLLTDDEVRRHARSDYLPSWYEVSPGDTITIERQEWGDDESEDDGFFTFIVPENLPSPPQRLDNHDRTGPRSLQYLKEHCEWIRSTEPPN